MQQGYKTAEEVLLARVDREGSSEEVTLIKSLRMKTNIEQKKTWVEGWSVRVRGRKVNQSVDQIICLGQLGTTGIFVPHYLEC